MQFPESVFEFLRQTRWDPGASRNFDVLAGGFVWSDEGFREAFQEFGSFDIGPFRCVLAYRASLSRGEPREELRGSWDQLLQACPNWPGFRAERFAARLADELSAANDEVLRQLDHMSEACARAQRMKEFRESRKRRWWQFWMRSK